MRLLSFLFVLIMFMGCGNDQTATYQMQPITVSGEFLFEGPNSLQGQPKMELEAIADEVGIDPTAIQSVFVQSATLGFASDSLSSFAESALIQWVSDELPLVSVATKNPLPAAEMINMEVNQEQDILPYLNDSSATLVVDVNLTEDFDSMDATVRFELNVVY